tara:strand:+ start:6807 stop:7604 length:798 start_codon:yes stop_codon:yes gene_type:complete
MVAEPLALDSGMARISKESDIKSISDESRIVIYTVDMTVAVKDPVNSMEFVSGLAAEFGGFVVNSNIYYGNQVDSRRDGTSDYLPEVYVALRVEANRLDEAISRIEDTGVVQGLSRSGQDITAEYTDIDSRLRNVMAAERQLLELMLEADSTESTMDVFRELTRVREQIEVLQGQKMYYEQASEFAYINVRIIPDPNRQPVDVLRWNAMATFKNAIESMIGGLQWVGDALIYLVVAVSPVLIVVFVPVYFLTRFVRRSIKSRRSK